MEVIPTQAVPSQVFSTVLAGQNCEIAIFQKTTGLYLNLLVNGAPIILGTLCLVGNRLVRSSYLGFSGDMAWVDTQPSMPSLVDGVSPDQVTSVGIGPGGRYFLAYLP